MGKQAKRSKAVKATQPQAEPKAPASAMFFEWRKVGDEKPLTVSAAILDASTAYRSACWLVDVAIKNRDEAARKLLDLASGKSADAKQVAA